MTQTPPLILGHRGARKYAPENSIPAFKKAISLSLDGVEFDVMSTLDGLPVVVHDDNLHKLTGQDIHVHKTPYVDLQNIDIGRQYSSFYAGETIPIFKEVLALFKETSMLLNIEIKYQPSQHKNFIRRVLEMIEESGLAGQVIISSFNREMLYRIGRAAPHLKRSLLLHQTSFFFVNAVFFASMLAVNGLNPHISRLNKYSMRYAQTRGFYVITWTANSVEEIEKAVKFGVNGIITDEPVLAREILKKYYG